MKLQIQRRISGFRWRKFLNARALRLYKDYWLVFQWREPTVMEFKHGSNKN